MIFVELRNYWLDMCLCSHITVFSYLFYRISTTHRGGFVSASSWAKLSPVGADFKTITGISLSHEDVLILREKRFVRKFLSSRLDLVWCDFFGASLGKSLSDKKEQTTGGIMKRAMKSENRKSTFGDCYLGKGFSVPSPGDNHPMLIFNPA